MGLNVKNNLMIHFTEIIEEEMQNKIKNENLKIKTRKDTPSKSKKYIRYNYIIIYMNK